jgi:hypothetical protein
MTSVGLLFFRCLRQISAKSWLLFRCSVFPKAPDSAAETGFLAVFFWITALSAARAVREAR